MPVAQCQSAPSWAIRKSPRYSQYQLATRSIWHWLRTNQLDTSLDPYFQTIAELQVSAHVFIERDGAITQFVPFEARAWHAGASSFEGIANCNDYSIGIELEGCDNIAYTDAQYDALAKVTRQILAAYPLITPERIVGHNHIAPERKTDPGEAFDWGRFYKLLGDS
jgi:AmpD protein